MRLRIELYRGPTRALILTDTPEPDCLRCDGDGHIPHDYGDENGEYAGTHWESCHCWNPRYRLTLLPLPRLPHLRRRTEPADPWGSGGYSSEPPL